MGESGYCNSHGSVAFQSRPANRQDTVKCTTCWKFLSEMSTAVCFHRCLNTVCITTLKLPRPALQHSSFVRISTTLSVRIDALPLKDRASSDVFWRPPKEAQDFHYSRDSWSGRINRIQRFDRSPHLHTIRLSNLLPRSARLYPPLHGSTCPSCSAHQSKSVQHSGILAGDMPISARSKSTM